MNNTFYRFPKYNTLLSWRDTVLGEFLFTLKGSRYVTHMKKLKDVKKSVEKFYDSANLLEKKQGCVLWQLPPNLNRNDEKLLFFCKNLKRGFKNVIEFRHSSWFTDDVYEILSENDVSFCSISSPDLPDDLITTNKVAYIRFHGEGRDWYDYHYSKKELQAW